MKLAFIKTVFLMVINKFILTNISALLRVSVSIVVYSVFENCFDESILKFRIFLYWQVDEWNRFKDHQDLRPPWLSREKESKKQEKNT